MPLEQFSVLAEIKAVLRDTADAPTTATTKDAQGRVIQWVFTYADRTITYDITYAGPTGADLALVDPIVKTVALL